MRSLALALLATLAAVSGLAQADPLRSTGGDEKAFAKLRGITFFFIDVSTSESRPEDADLRGEIRDGMELELRRANLTPKSVEGLSPEAATPLLLLAVGVALPSIGFLLLAAVVYLGAALVAYVVFRMVVKFLVENRCAKYEDRSICSS